MDCLLALLLAFFMLGEGSARVVRVSSGPLIRVEGQPVSIRCDVSEYGGPREQDFEWMIFQEPGSKKTKIISTFDAGYSDPSLSKRVASGDISVVRLQDNEVELKVAEVKASDAGFYLCQTPSTDSVISGNYEEHVQLIVIPNTLKVSPQAPPPVVPEGSDITLTCNVTREMTQPTYLSVTWSVKRGTSSEDILVFGPQGEVVVGSKFARRYADGGIRLVPGRNGVFELVVTRVTTSDDGIYECNGTEWTHEEGGRWVKIVESKKEMGTVSVTPTGQSLSVKLSPSSPLLLIPGNALTLLCSVSADNLPALALEVTWLLDGRDIITMERSGVVVSNSSSPSSSSGGAQGRRGKVSLERTGAGEYRLEVRAVSGEDGGAYTCRVRAFVEKGGRSSGGGGRWHMAAEKTSSAVTVKVTSIKPSFTLTLDPVLTPLMTADPTELACHVTNITHLPPGGRLAVTWEHTSLPGEADDPPTSVPIGSLDAKGNLMPGQLYTDRMKSGALSLSRIQPNTFTLRVLQTQEKDMGQYVCSVSAWTLEGQGDLIQSSEFRSSALAVRWDAKRPTLNVVAKQVREASVGGATFEMSCTVATENLGEAGYSVLIQSQDSLQGNVRTIMTLSPDSVMQHGGATDPNRRDSLVLTKSGPGEFRFRLAGVQLSDRGFYWCDITAWTKQQPGQTWTKATSAESNKIRIDFQENGPTLNVVAKQVREASVGGATFEMSCTVATENLGEAGYSVLIQSQDSLQGNVRTIMTLSPDSVMQHGGATDPNRRDSLVLTKSGPGEFRFRLAGVQLSDRGFYWCDITAWTKQQPGQTWTKATSAESNKIRIDFQENGPSFSIAIQSDASTVYPWETAKMECSLSVSGSSPKTDDLAYEVRWFFTRLRGGQVTSQVASVDRFGVVRKDARNSSSDVSIERKDTHTYLLNIHGTQDSDSGEYHCGATPWYLSPSTGAWTQAAELTSSRVFLTVKFAVWDSLKLPLLYGVSASVGVGLFSLVLGLVCAHCCCRNTTHTPRSRNKLMDLEMD